MVALDLTLKSTLAWLTTGVGTRLLAATGGSLAGLTVLAFSLSSASTTASSTRATAATELSRDPASVLDQRSPGGRSAGILAQTKLTLERVTGRPRAAPFVPHQRVLPNARTRTPSAVPALSAPEAFPSDVVGLGSPLVEDAAPIGTGPLFGGGGLPGIGGVISGPGSGGGGGGGGTDGTPPGGGPTTDVPPGGSSPAVPEPASWLMMFIGFGAVGGMLRRHKTSTAGGIAAAYRRTA